MLMRHRSSKNASTDLKLLGGQSPDETARHWLEVVLADSLAAVPATASEDEDPFLIYSVPFVLDEILFAIDSGQSKVKCNIRSQKICGAARYGRERARRHSDAGELLREYQLMREQIFLYLREHLAQFTGHDVDNIRLLYSRVGLALDDAVRETIKSFVEEQTRRLLHLSRTDSLTGLYNHRTFYERLDEEFTRAKRYQSPLSIVLLDLDNFKAVNDLKGHQFGDYLLVKCAELLRHELRQTDVICRYGGDEFGIILPETIRTDARAMMTRLVDEFRKLGAQEDAPPEFGMSFGLAAHPEDNGTVRRLVQVADVHLLQAKQKQE